MCYSREKMTALVPFSRLIKVGFLITCQSNELGSDMLLQAT